MRRRLVQAARLQAEEPGRAFGGIAAADEPTARAYYRLIDKADEAGPDMDRILAPHRQQTLRRMQAQTTVLCVQDGSTLDFSETGHHYRAWNSLHYRAPQVEPLVCSCAVL